MRRILIVLSFLSLCLHIFAQNDVTKFLGIPVDGPKSEMIRKLKAKGFILNGENANEFLTGRFNGMDVRVYISTENGQIARIMVCDATPMDETDIKIRFNRLCQQFKNNGKYISLDDFSIPETDDISYEMSVRNKRYEALFYQLPEGDAFEQLKARIIAQVQSKYTQEQLQNPSEDIKTEVISESLSALVDAVHNKPVWFMITEHFGKFYITMFYDNEYNRAQGEDL